jgi:hypothetical protein
VVKRTVATVIVALVVAPVVRADMMPVASLDGGSRQSLSICDGRVPRGVSDSHQRVAFFGPVDLDLLQGGFVPLPNPEVGQPNETMPALVLTDRQNSLTLCLYALLGLGLCRSAPLVKKLHFGCITDWYHSGGPSQIGHSFAISSDCLPAAPIFCFLQPDYRPEEVAPQYSRGTIAALLREAQFQLTALASRGPPCLGNEAVSL